MTKTEGLTQLSDDELEAVSGGWTDCNDVEERNDPNVHYADDHRAK